MVQFMLAISSYRFGAGWILLLTSLVFTQALAGSQLAGPDEQVVVAQEPAAQEPVATDDPEAPVKSHAWPAYAELDDLYAGMRPLLERELTARQVDEPADLYKFLFQGVMGPAHADIEPDHALAWLKREWQEMSATGAEGTSRFPVLEPLRPDNQLARLHLQALVDRVTAEVPVSERDQVINLTWERLATVFSRTAEGWPTDLGVLRGLWERVVVDHDLWREHFSSEELNRFTQEVSDAQWPAVHHGDAYRERWQPHYRVVSPFLLPPAWREESGGEENERENR